MKNPHIRTLPSDRPFRDMGAGIRISNARMYVKRRKKERRLWLLGKGLKPQEVGDSIGMVERVTFIVSPYAILYPEIATKEELAHMAAARE